MLEDRGIDFIDSEDREFKDTMKNVCKKLETPMACKASKKSEHGETRGKTNEFKSKFACILEASESTKLRMEKSLPNYNEDHIYSFASSYVDSRSTSSCGLRMGETWKRQARTMGAKVHFASLMDICHLKNAEMETKHPKFKGRVVLQGDIVLDVSGSYAVFSD